MLLGWASAMRKSAFQAWEAIRLRRHRGLIHFVNLLTLLPHEFAHLVVANYYNLDPWFDTEDIAVRFEGMDRSNAGAVALFSLAPLTYGFVSLAVSIADPIVAAPFLIPVVQMSRSDLRGAYQAFVLLRTDWELTEYPCPECDSPLLSGKRLLSVNVYCENCAMICGGSGAEDAVDIWRSDSLSDYLEDEEE